MASNPAGKQESPAPQRPDQENPQPGGHTGTATTSAPACKTAQAAGTVAGWDGSRSDRMS